MIGYLEGRIIRRETESILLLAGHIGYEILMDPVTLSRAEAESASQDKLSLYIYYHVTDRQPKPVLIGFLTPEDKEFFQLFITVSAIGPMKAVKALTKPVGEVALAIESRDTRFLSQLSGIGKRTAEKIIATLHGKVTEFADASRETSMAEPAGEVGGQISEAREDISRQVADVLMEQLGHSASSAKRMIMEAFDRNPGIGTPEDLFDEIYKEGR